MKANNNSASFNSFASSNANTNSTSSSHLSTTSKSAARSSPTRQELDDKPEKRTAKLCAYLINREKKIKEKILNCKFT